MSLERSLGSGAVKRFLVSVMLVVCASGARALTLKEAFESAKKTTSLVANTKLDILKSEAEASSLRSSIKPTVELTSDNVFRDELLSSSSVASSFGEAHQHNAEISVSQTVFRKGTLDGLKYANNLPKVARLGLRRAEINLYLSVAESFLRLASLRQEVLDLEEQSKLLNDRIKEIKERAKIGRSKKTDLLSAQSGLARISADMASLRSQLILAEQDLAKKTGLEDFLYLQDEVDVAKLTPEPNWKDEVLKVANIRAAELNLEQLKLQVNTSKSDYWPTLDLTGNYYLERSGVLAESEWDVTLGASWEIYSGGETQSSVEIQKIELRKQEQTLSELKRNASIEFEARKREFQSRKKELIKLKEALRLAKSSYLEHRKEARSGLVSSLEVLRSLDDFLQIKRIYNQRSLEGKLSWVRLQALAGVTP